MLRLRNLHFKVLKGTVILFRIVRLGTSASLLVTSALLVVTKKLVETIISILFLLANIVPSSKALWFSKVLLFRIVRLMLFWTRPAGTILFGEDTPFAAPKHRPRAFELQRITTWVSGERRQWRRPRILPVKGLVRSTFCIGMDIRPHKLSWLGIKPAFNYAFNRNLIL